MISLSLTELAQQLELTPPTREATFTGISKDTRTIVPGNLYVAIQGEQFDGHDYVGEAFKKGASAALVSRPIDLDIPQLLSENTVLTLGKISKFWRKNFSCSFIGVTGSNGKTTLKNMIATILKTACGNDDAVLATEGNLNNNIGVPLMLARLNKQHRYAVIEMGMNHFNEIAYLTRLVCPNIAIVNNAAEAHLEGLKTVAGVAKAKGEIFQGLTADGTAILNADDAHFSYWQSLVTSHNVLSFGLDQPADIHGSLRNSQLTIQTPNGMITVNLPLLGKHNAANALAATAATLAAGISLDIIKKGLEKLHPTPGRMCLYTLEDGAQVIDDTYNANPFSLRAAVNTLATYSHQKIVVLGDMKELGDEANELHAACGADIRAAGIHHLFTVGNLSAYASKAFGENAHHFTTQDELVAALKPFIKNNTTVLIKGSRSTHMEKIVNQLVPAKQLEHFH